MADSEGSSRPRRWSGWLARLLEDSDSDHSVAEAIGLAVAVLYVPLAVVGTIVSIIHILWTGLSGIPELPGRLIETQIKLIATRYSILGTSGVVAALYGAALYAIMSKRRAILIGWIVYTTLVSFAAYQGDIGISVSGANTAGRAVAHAFWIAWPIVIVPFIMDLAPGVGNRIASGPTMVGGTLADGGDRDHPTDSEGTAPSADETGDNSGGTEPSGTDHPGDYPYTEGGGRK